MDFEDFAGWLGKLVTAWSDAEDIAETDPPRFLRVTADLINSLCRLTEAYGEDSDVAAAATAPRMTAFSGISLAVLTKAAIRAMRATANDVHGRVKLMDLMGDGTEELQALAAEYDVAAVEAATRSGTELRLPTSPS